MNNRENLNRWTQILIAVVVAFIMLLFLLGCEQKEAEEEIEPRICFDCTTIHIISTFGSMTAEGPLPILSSQTSTLGKMNICTLNLTQVKAIEGMGSSVVYSIIAGIGVEMKTKVECKVRK